jgi:hypothetical protein
MNRKHLLCVFWGLGFLFAVPSSYALGKISFGPRLSTNFDTASITNYFFPADSVKTQSGFSVGGTVQLNLGPGFDLALDALASHSELFFVSNSFSIDAYQLSFWTIDTPLVLYYSPIPEFFIGIGAYASFGIGKIGRLGSYSGQSGTPLYKDDSVSYAAEGWRRASFGGTLAIGAATPFGQSQNEMYVEARLYWGFSDRSDDPAAVLRNRSYDIGMGVLF